MRQLQRGNVDNEGCVRFWMLGYELMITPDTIVAHKFRKRSPYRVGWPEFMFNRLRLAFAHFGPRAPRARGGQPPQLSGIRRGAGALAESNIAERRRELQARRVRDDDWYCKRFNMTW